MSPMIGTIGIDQHEVCGCCAPQLHRSAPQPPISSPASPTDDCGGGGGIMSALVLIGRSCYQSDHFLDVLIDRI